MQCEAMVTVELMTMNGPRCEKCFYFDLMPTSPQTGLCRLMPPTVIPTQVNMAAPGPGVTNADARTTKPFTTWPVVRKSDWCGKYAPNDGGRDGKGVPTA